VVDKGDLGGGLAILAGMVGAAASWAAGLGVVTILISVGIGSLLTYMVGTKTQKNAWKREDAKKKVEEIYGPVYFELNRIYQAISQFPDQWYLVPTDQNQVTWESIQAGYRYYLVDLPLRKQLDDFFSLLKEYNLNNGGKSGVVMEKLLPRLKDAFGADAQAAQYNVSATSLNGMPSSLPGATLDGPILAGELPLEYTKKQYSKMADYHLEVYVQRGGTMTPLFTAKSPNPEYETKFNELIRATIEDVNKDPRIILTNEQRMQLLEQARSLKEKLRVKTEEPWKV
jgi:hypothetical protein